MSNVRFKLNSAGLTELMQSAEMQSVLQGYADQVQSRCTAGNVSPEEFGTKVFVASTRAVAKVYPKTPHARNSNLAHNTLLKALGQG